MKGIITYIFLLIIILPSCDKALMGPDPDSSDKTCFKILWTDFDQHYPSFIIKNLNWDSVYNVEMNQIDKRGLLYVLADVARIIKDGHFDVFANGVDIYSPPPWIRRISNSPINIKHYILLSTLDNNKNIKYGIYNNIGYISIQSFDLDKTFYNDILNLIISYKDMDGIIIDVRDNLGGFISNSDIVAGAFTDKEVLCWKSRFRNGLSHNDFGNWINYYVEPTASLAFLKPVTILTNKKSSSAAEFFCLSMHALPKTTIIGDTTDGTISDNEYHDLPNGWIYRMSISTTATIDGKIYESKGIPPDIPLWISKHDSIIGKDDIFEKAVDIINSKK